MNEESDSTDTKNSLLQAQSMMHASNMQYSEISSKCSVEGIMRNATTNQLSHRLRCNQIQRKLELQDVVETKEYHRSYKEIKNVQCTSTITSLMGLFIAIFSFEVDVWYSTEASTIPTDDKIQKEYDLMLKYYGWSMWVLFGLTALTLVLISYKNYLKIIWTNTYFNKLLRKEQISDNSLYYHFSLEIIGEENVNSDVKDGIHIKQAKFLNWKYLKEMIVHVVQPLPLAIME